VSPLESHIAVDMNVSNETDPPNVGRSDMTRFNIPLRASAAAAALFATLLVFTVSAHAEPASVITSAMTVRYSDLDLSSAQGAQVLYRRIVAAANQLCSEAGVRDLRRTSAADVCAEQAVARAVAGVHSPRLAALYSTHVNRG
jgi:UrcA family protein